MKYYQSEETMVRLITTKVTIVVSRQDKAGLNMLEQLKTKDNFESLPLDPPSSWPPGDYKLLQADDVSIIVIPGDQIFVDYFKGFIDTELMVFASKHKSAAGKKSLLVHTTGNWNEESGHGGNDFEISYAPSSLLTKGYDLIKELQKERGLEKYWTGIECTHHGPTSLEYPIAYFETGGTEEEWKDEKACNLIADVIWLSIKNFIDNTLEKRNTFIGIGGNHYCSSFIKTLDEEDMNYGHIIPKYAHKDMPIEMLRKAYDKTQGEKKLFLVDKKGCRSADRKRFINFFEENNYEWKYT